MGLCVLGWVGLVLSFCDDDAGGDSFVLFGHAVSVLQPVCRVILVVGSEVPELVLHKAWGSTVQCMEELGVFPDGICRNNRDLICNRTNLPTGVIRESGLGK